MSTTATSGRWASALRRNASASPAWLTTSKPPSASSRAIPSRMRTSSSPMTTRTGSDTEPRYSQLLPKASGPLLVYQERAEPAVRQLLLGHERQPVASVVTVQGATRVPVGRGQDNARRPRQCRELVSEVDPLAIRKPDVDKPPARPRSVRRLDRRGRVLRCRHDLDSHGLEGPLGERQETWVVV